MFPLALLCFTSPLQAIILYGRGNDDPATTSNPGNGVPWDSVAKVINTNGTGLHGSAVHLGFGFMISAHHVGTNNRAVSFDGVTSYLVDNTFEPVRIGTTDLRIFKLEQIPDVPAVNLYAGTNTTQTGYHVGWGVGRDPNVAVNTNVVNWGTTATSDKRWGTNNPAATQSVTYTFGATTYTQESLITVVGNNAGATQASLTLYDSGSGFFQEYDGIWYLTGIAFTVSNVSGANTSTFGTQNVNQPAAQRGDLNYLVNISEYQEEILAVIPEPATQTLVLGLLAGLIGLVRFGKNHALFARLTGKNTGTGTVLILKRNTADSDA
ncbi:MAG: hypothetical protein LR015_12100 [Verrucomicrobia bacterium]|nr:hypothetical protein [Verrucomicrobiota bacterium]